MSAIGIRIAAEFAWRLFAARPAARANLIGRTIEQILSRDRSGRRYGGRQALSFGIWFRLRGAAILSCEVSRTVIKPVASRKPREPDLDKPSPGGADATGGLGFATRGPGALLFGGDGWDDQQLV